MKTSGLEKSIQFFRLWCPQSNFRNCITILPYNGSYLLIFHNEDNTPITKELHFSSLSNAIKHGLDNGYVFTPASVYINPLTKG